MKLFLAVLGMILIFSSICLAQGGRVTYADGQPAAGAEVHIHLLDVDKFNVLADKDGRFTLPTSDFLDAMIQVKAPDGIDFATVNLPATLFESGDVAIVLQPKK
jgi:hypothetical protein